MYHVSAQGVDERLINVHDYYYLKLKKGGGGGGGRRSLQTEERTCLGACNFKACCGKFFH